MAQAGSAQLIRKPETGTTNADLMGQVTNRFRTAAVCMATIIR